MFATDSVERYAIDYNKGYLSSAVATLSLLGILGYIRALLKLGMGLEACGNAGLDVKALRPLFGIPDADRLPSDEIHEVHYIQRHLSNHTVTWKETRTMKHTLESMGLLSQIHKSHPHNQDFRMIRVWGKVGRHFRSPVGDLTVLLFSFLSIGVTSCLIVLLQPSTTWSLLFATVGLFLPVSTTSLMWAWVFAQEQLPSHESNLAETSPWLGEIAFARSKNSYYFPLRYRTIDGPPRTFIQAVSLLAALIAIVG